MAARTKAEVKEVSVEDKLASLYSLQLIVSEIDRIKTLRGELPLEVQDLEDEVAGLETRSANYVEEIENFKQDIGRKKIEIEQASALVQKYDAQQMNVRNNKEYDFLTKEIEFQRLEVELCEKRIGEYSVGIEQKSKELEKVNDVMKEKKIDLQAKKVELEDIIAETKQEEEKLRTKAKKVEALIEPRLLVAFKRIRKSVRNGLSVVSIERDSCAGCFNKIPPQRQLDIKLRKKIIVCEYCGRFMIDPELAAVK